MARRAQARTPKPEPVIITRPHPRTMEEALRVAAGDRERLEFLADGSVIVWNGPVRISPRPVSGSVRAQPRAGRRTASR